MRNKPTHFKRLCRLSLLFTLILLLTGTAKVSASAASDRKKQIREAVSGFYDAIAAGKLKTAGGTLSDDVVKPNGNCGSDYLSQLKKHNRRIGYRFLKITSDKRTATVRLRVSYPDLSFPHQFAMDDLARWIKLNPQKQASIPQKYSRFLRSYLTPASTTAMKKVIVVIRLKKVGRTWKICELDENAMNSITGGYFEALGIWEADL